mmetsp:Transcript_17112/g.64827  ORF Transcript_17112/g.64827 Transcript_17112/m.64827 type:complete len:225 (+) Transcript_17112:296-970(+)
MLRVAPGSEEPLRCSRDPGVHLEVGALKAAVPVGAGPLGGRTPHSLRVALAILLAVHVAVTTGAAATAAKRDVIVVVAVAVIVDRVGGDLVCCRAPGHPLVVVEVSAKVAQGLAELQQHVLHALPERKHHGPDEARLQARLLGLRVEVGDEWRRVQAVGLEEAGLVLELLHDAAAPLERDWDGEGLAREVRRVDHGLDERQPVRGAVSVERRQGQGHRPQHRSR